MESMETAQTISEQIIPILRQHHVEHASLFGSFARGEQTDESDVDLLVEFEEQYHASLLDIAGLKVDLEDQLGRKVDVVSTGAKIHPEVRATMEENLTPLL